MFGHSAKSTIAQIFRLPGLFDLCYRGLGARQGTNYLRAVNYHSTPPEFAAAFETHLQFFARYYQNVSLDDLDVFFEGNWPHSKPGIIISFDDGLRSNFEVAKPLLEKYGFTGWFMVPVELLSDRLNGRACSITPDRQYADGRHMMTCNEVRSLAEKHVVACHTAEHVRMNASLSPQVVEAEIAHAKHSLEQILGNQVVCFCWVGGELENYSNAAARVISESGFQYSFMTCSGSILPTTNKLQLHRTNVEVTFGVPLVRFQLSGAMDIFHWRRRKLVNTLTQIAFEE